MSVDYASGLSDYEHKGICGLPEVFDDEDKLEVKAKLLADWIRAAKHVVLYVGAGLSTAAGIPDFRGPRGVWTLEKRGERLSPEKLRSFADCRPTYGHRAIQALIEAKLVHFVVSQNIDGLFVKSGLSRQSLAELHGNYFVDQCSHCQRRFVRNRASPTMGCRPTGEQCPRRNPRPCRGHLVDTILDWEQALPEEELIEAERQSQLADLAICLGTTLQIEPAGSLPLRVIKKKNIPKNTHNNKKNKKNNKRKQPEPDDSVIKKEEDDKNEVKMDIKTDNANGNKESQTEGIKQEPLEGDSKLKTDESGKLVIINLQKTRFDKRAHLLVHHYIDNILEKVCSHLQIPVSEYDQSKDLTHFSRTDLIEWKR